MTAFNDFLDKLNDHHIENLDFIDHHVFCMAMNWLDPRAWSPFNKTGWYSGFGFCEDNV